VMLRDLQLLYAAPGCRRAAPQHDPQSSWVMLCTVQNASRVTRADRKAAAAAAAENQSVPRNLSSHFSGAASVAAAVCVGVGAVPAGVHVVACASGHLGAPLLLLLLATACTACLASGPA
jgi:hypothetical protein